MCATGNGRVRELARELQRLKSDFFKDFPERFGDFDWVEYRKGLDYFQENYDCLTCKNIKDPW
jgi:hypothetical protein